MSSRSEEETSINPAITNKEECKLLDGKENGDVEIGNIQDTVKYLLDSTQKHCNKISPSIHRIPSRIRELNEKVFNPRQVSIGPLHRDLPNLQAFEGQKAIFLNDLLIHSGLPVKQTMETCVQKVNASIGRIKACYGDVMKKYNDDNEITRMMVMDGCFILEFIYKTSKGLFDENMVIEPISMAFDLVLIENQIPFFVLQDIFECTSSRFKPVTSLHALIINGLVPALGFFQSKFEIKNDEVFKTSHNHILGFIHECYIPLGDVDKKNVDKKKPSSDSETYYSAVELDRSGVNFKPHRQSKDRQWPMDIQLELPRFSWWRPWAKPTLRMPVLHIDNYTELVFRNLIAYEQLSPRWVRHYITSYAVAMDLLIDNHEDVARLVKSKVIINTIGSNEEAAKLINDMRKGISCPHFFYIEVWKAMNGHHDRFWPRNIARLRRTYFSNPWSIIAVFAGMFLFLFTVVQTFYTVNPV